MTYALAFLLGILIGTAAGITGGALLAGWMMEPKPRRAQRRTHT